MRLFKEKNLTEILKENFPFSSIGTIARIRDGLTCLQWFSLLHTRTAGERIPANVQLKDVSVEEVTPTLETPARMMSETPPFPFSRKLHESHKTVFNFAGPHPDGYRSAHRRTALSAHADSRARIRGDGRRNACGLARVCLRLPL